MKSTIGFAILASWLIACPPAGTSTEGSPQKPTGACTKAGQNCEYAPGKIGLCTAKVEGCTEASCLSCMSLH